MRDYEYFLAVTTEKSFSKAAAACNVSQPTLSVQLKKLEERLGTPLFERHPRQVLLTAAGQAILPKVQHMLVLQKEIQQMAQAAKDPLAGAVRLGIIPTLGAYVLPYLVPFFQEHAPNLRPEFIEGKTATLLEKLGNGEVDLALLALPLKGAEVFSLTPLLWEDFYLALPPQHPLAKIKNIRTQDLRQGELLLLEEGHCLRDHALDVCPLLGKAQNINLHSTSLETLRYMAMAGQGVTVLPALAVGEKAGQPHCPGLSLRPFQGQSGKAGVRPRRQIGLACRYGYPRAQAFKKLFAVFAQVLATRHQGVHPF